MPQFLDLAPPRAETVDCSVYHLRFYCHRIALIVYGSS